MRIIEREVVPQTSFAPTVPRKATREVASV